MKMNQLESQTSLNAEVPFPGLSYYEENDSCFFFGRESEKDELNERLKKLELLVHY